MPTAGTSRRSTFESSTSTSTPRRDAAADERVAEAGEGFSEYDGMMVEMEEGTLAIDDISHYETERLIELMKPDIVCGGIKEKYAIQKLGVPSKQLHSYDYGGPYAGFAGAINFWRDIDQDGQQPDLEARSRPLGPSCPRPRARGRARTTKRLRQPRSRSMLLRHTTHRCHPTERSHRQSGQDLPAHRRHVRGARHSPMPSALVTAPRAAARTIDPSSRGTTRSP